MKRYNPTRPDWCDESPNKIMKEDANGRFVLYSDFAKVVAAFRQAVELGQISLEINELTKEPYLMASAPDEIGPAADGKDYPELVQCLQAGEGLLRSCP